MPKWQKKEVIYMKTVWVIYIVVDDPISDGLYDKNLDFESGAFASAEEAKRRALDVVCGMTENDIEIEEWTDEETGEKGYDVNCGVVTVQVLPLALH